MDPEPESTGAESARSESTVSEPTGSESTVIESTVSEPTDSESTEAASGWAVSKVVGLVAAVALLAVVATVVLTDRLGTPSSGSVDVGFLQDMTAHHGQAVEIAAIGAENATDPEMRSFAREVLIFQQYEVGYMEALLEEWGYSTGDSDRTAMKWMNMSSPVAAMPGMSPDSALRNARTVTGPAANAEYLRLMYTHHRGGIHMAEYAAKNAKDPRVVALAERIQSQQSSELADYERAAAKLGIKL